MPSPRRLFRPDTPVETFGLVPRPRCEPFDAVPALAIAAALAFVAWIVFFSPIAALP